MTTMTRKKQVSRQTDMVLQQCPRVYIMNHKHEAERAEKGMGI